MKLSQNILRRIEKGNGGGGVRLTTTTTAAALPFSDEAYEPAFN